MRYGDDFSDELKEGIEELRLARPSPPVLSGDSETDGFSGVALHV